MKLPGTPEGRSAFADKLMQDAEAKASNAGVRYFFTWNVNKFVMLDRSLWDRPLLERRVRVWRLGALWPIRGVAREENLDFIKTHFLPDLLRDLADIISGRRAEWLPPDDLFIRSLESHLDWPVQLSSAYILQQASKNKRFWPARPAMDEGPGLDFRSHAARGMGQGRGQHGQDPGICLGKPADLFYKALRARFPDLPRLATAAVRKESRRCRGRVQPFFQEAVERSGDYEPLLMPEATDWATALVFQPANALDAWRGLLRGIESVDFREVSVRRGGAHLPESSSARTSATATASISRATIRWT